MKVFSSEEESDSTSMIQSTDVFAGKCIHKTINLEKKNTSVSEKRTRKLISVDF